MKTVLNAIFDVIAERELKKLTESLGLNALSSFTKGTVVYVTVPELVIKQQNLDKNIGESCEEITSETPLIYLSVFKATKRFKEVPMDVLLVDPESGIFYNTNCLLLNEGEEC